MTKPPIPTENSKTKGQHTNATKNFENKVCLHQAIHNTTTEEIYFNLFLDRNVMFRIIGIESEYTAKSATYTFTVRKTYVKRTLENVR